MDKELKVKEIVEEVNPIDEYLNNYKENKLAEFCVNKDKEIEGLKREKHDYTKKLADMKEKVKEYDKCFNSVNELYKRIKAMPVDEYLNLYNKFVDDISNRNIRVSTIATSSPYITTSGIFC